ncbi:MAG TPA: BamA/TamA family outer membrane protein [Gemmatimonadaceae bacterium]|nr:BamA/TamA family outer membrane protein [Gemmatimonadaceae bacterium]
MGSKARRVMQGGYARAILISGFALLGTTFARPASGQEINCDAGDKEVRRLSFSGNTAFTDSELSKIIVTTASPFARTVLRLPLAARHCLDRNELPKDRARLVIFYRRRGFSDATVDTAIKTVRRGVEVTFLIHEGAPTRLATLVIQGLDSVRDKGAIIRGLPIRAGHRFDRVNLDAARDTIARRLRNSGYPRVEVNNAFEVDEEKRLAFDTISVSPGPFTRLGQLDVHVVPFEKKTQQVPSRVVRRIIGFDSGQVYREEDLLDAQRTLYRTEAYQHVSIIPDTAMGPADSVVRIKAVLAENSTRSARLGAGYGTLDCFRVTGELSNYNFLRTARRLDLTTRVSKIGIGDPISGFNAMCPQARRDPFSRKLNYYVGATLRQPVFSGLAFLPTVTLFSERISEYNAYLRTTTIGGIASLEWRRWEAVPVTFAYSLDLGRTEAQPALFCAVFNVCDREDRRRLQQTQRLAVASVVVSRDKSNNFISPTRGFQWRIEARHASPLIASDTALQFNKIVAERSQYWTISNRTVLAFRVRGGAVFGRSFGTTTGFIPPQERLYAGGPTTVRGFSQNELGSAIYISDSYRLVLPTATVRDSLFRVADSVRSFRRAVPVGGNSMVVSNLELRFPSPFLSEFLQWTFFTDAGDVWNRGGTGSFQRFSIKVTPGVQLTGFSPVGPVRLVVGYNPYRRPSGPLYYEVPGGTPVDDLGTPAGSLPCVSPGNLLPVHRTSDGLKQTEGRCPPTFTPRTSERFLSRLTFGLAIGQAF